jgi:hypothetical protein
MDTSGWLAWLGRIFRAFRPFCCASTMLSTAQNWLPSTGTLDPVGVRAIWHPISSDGCIHACRPVPGPDDTENHCFNSAPRLISAALSTTFLEMANGSW